MFRHTCEAAVAAGARSLALWVFWENGPAVRVYRTVGFALDEGKPVKWLMRQFPYESAPVPHIYVKMTRAEER